MLIKNEIFVSVFSFTKVFQNSNCTNILFQDLAEALFSAACHNVRNHLKMLDKQGLVCKSI
jgi:hypothetical protein